MTNERDLFNAIVENPDDIALRLIYADWCDERGDERGEFIRIQCELARQSNSAAATQALQQRQAQLLDQYRRDWNGAVHRRLAKTPVCNRVHTRRGAIRRWEYRRGFVEFVVLEARTLLRYPNVLLQIGPINTLRIVRAENCVGPVLKSPVLPRMTLVELVLPHLRRDQAESQIASSRPRDLKDLEIRPLNCLATVETLGTALFVPQTVGIFSRIASFIRPN